MADREMRFERKMSDAEALMWNVENDPRLSSNVGTVTVLDRPLDFPQLRKRIAAAVADIPRMRERVAPVLGRLAPPNWEADPEFDLDYHLRRIALPKPGSDRQLFDLCAHLLAEPLDRTRPLWSFIAIDGLSGRRGALFTKLHHTVTDGEGGVRLAEKYMEAEREAPPPRDVDLDEIIAAERRESARADGASILPSIGGTLGHTARRVLGIARRTAGEAALAVVDPPRVAEGVRNIVRGVGSARDQLTTGSGGSPIWRQRSRYRWFGVLDVPFTSAKDAARNLGGSLNDFFVAGAAIAAVKYHDAVGAEAEHFNVTFVVSTRDDRSAGGNAFTPSKVRVPAGKMEPADRFAAVRDAMGSRRGGGGGLDLMGAVSGVANLLPTSVVTSIGRDQAAAVDFATSNVRAAPFDLYISGAKVLAPYPMGPVAGTAWNITMLSYAGSLYMGVHLDPVAVPEPDVLMSALRESYDELVEAAGVATEVTL